MLQWLIMGRMKALSSAPGAARHRYKHLHTCSMKRGPVKKTKPKLNEIKIVFIILSVNITLPQWSSLVPSLNPHGLTRMYNVVATMCSLPGIAGIAYCSFNTAVQCTLRTRCPSLMAPGSVSRHALSNTQRRWHKDTWVSTFLHVRWMTLWKEHWKHACTSYRISWNHLQGRVSEDNTSYCWAWN